jgi:hypothetical protein
MKPKTIHPLYEETPNGTPEEHPEKLKWLDKHIRTLSRNMEKPFLDAPKTKNKHSTPPPSE